MKTLVFTTVKICLWAYALAQIRQTELKLPGLILDITEPVNGLLGGKTSIGDFKKQVRSVKTLATLKNTPPALFSKIDSETLDVFAAQIRQVVQALHQISESGIWQLVISWTVDITSEQDLSNRLNTSFEIETAKFPNIRLSIILNFHSKTKCDDFTHVKHDSLAKRFRNLVLTFSQIQNVRVGVGCDKALVYCHNNKNVDNDLFRIIKGMEVTLSMYNIEFEGNDGVTESHTLFKSEMEYWDYESKADGFNTEEIIYRPTLESTGDIMHQRLLIKYSKLLAADKNHHSNFIVPTLPEQDDKIDGNQHFQVIPYLNTIRLDADVQPQWTDWAPVVLEAALKGFNTFLLTRDQWSSINSPEIVEMYTNHQITARKTPLKIIVDLPNTQMEFDWDSLNTSRLLRPVVLEAFLFEIDTSSVEGYKPFINFDIARNMSSKYTIGCSFKQESFSSINSTTCVEACNKINGSLYVLKWVTAVEWEKEYEYSRHGYKNLMYYHDYFKKELNKIKHLRDGIQQENPQSIVYFHVYLTKVFKVTKKRKTRLIT